MTDDQRHRILDRVRKMLRLAQDAGATEGERDNAMRMAHATLAKYNLELAETEVQGGSTSKEEPREKQSEDFLGHPWALQISAAIARLYFCFYYYQGIRGNGGPNRKAKHVFVGRHSNAITAKEMAAFVTQAVHREACRYQRAVKGNVPIYRAFAQAAAQKVRLRVHEILEATKAQTTAPKTPGTALVLASVYKTEEQANLQFLQGLGMKFGHGRQQSFAGDAAARTAGAAYGASVSLQRQIGEGSKYLK